MIKKASFLLFPLDQSPRNPKQMPCVVAKSTDGLVYVLTLECVLVICKFNICHRPINIR
jgi:hypothetical protein